MAGADMAADDKVDRIVFATQTECAVCPNVFSVRGPVFYLI